MAVHFRNGSNHKDYLPVPTPIYQKAVAAAKTYEWVEEKVEEISENADESSPPKPEYPKKFRCLKTGLVATKMQDGSPVMLVKGELLTLTSDEQTVKDIIE